jgi:hypothetical protein
VKEMGTLIIEALLLGAVLGVMYKAFSAEGE